MSPLSSFLDLQYNLSKKLETRLTKRLSARNGRQLSSLFLPNPDETRGVFNMMDRDGDGKISRQDLRRLLGATKPTLTPDVLDMEVEAMMNVAAGDGSCLTFKDFMELHKGGVKAGEIQRAFWVFDLDKDGRIGAEEVMVVMQRLGEKCGLEECRRMVRKLDRNGDGLVDMEDFMAMMTCTMKLAN